MQSNKILKIIIVIILAVALIYAILSMYLSQDTSLDTKFSGFGNMVAPGKKSSKSTDKLEVNMDRVLVNVRKGPYKYMKADMSFKMADESNKKALLSNMDQTRSVVLRFTSTQDSAQLATDEGKQKYKENLKKVISDNLGYRVNDVYFRNFVLAK